MKIYLAFLCLLFPFLGFTQEIDVSIEWEESDSLLYFDGASYHEEYALLPVYSQRLPWKDASMMPRLEISSYETSRVSEKYIFQSAGAELGESPAINTNIVFERKQAFLQITVLPFLKDQEGKIQKLSSFRLHLSAEKSFASLKSLKKGKFSSESLLASNDWYKIAIASSGIHKLSFENLQELGLDNPASVKIYGAGAVLLPEDYSKGAYDDLSEIPLYMSKGTDGLFGPGDFILFYAQGPVNWSYDLAEDFFSQELHHYSTRGYYFLTDDLGPASAPGNAELSTAPADEVVNTFDLLRYHEDEKYNLLSSGREWYGDKYSLSLTGTYPFSLDNLVVSEPVRIRVTAAVRSNEDSDIKVNANASSLGNMSFGTVNLSSYTSTYAVEKAEIFDYSSAQEALTVVLEYLQPNSNSEAWLNHITLNARARLELEGDDLSFRDSRSVAFGNITEFRISGAGSNTKIWDITEPGQTLNVPFTLEGSNAIFKIASDELREYVAFRTTGNFPVPEISGKGLGKISNQDLHGSAPPDLLIVYAEEFAEQAQRLAEHRREHDGFIVSLLTEEMVFNEFSSGTPNVSALRNYLKMYYDTSSPEDMISYLLLFGDGSFDNRDTITDNPNYILTYQSANSLVPTASYVSDDFYGLLDTGEKLTDGLLDIGIGRLPVSNTDEAEALVDKIISYDSIATIGEWRNFICLIGDDEDGNIHMRQANSLADDIEASHPEYNINKIFMDAYPQETTPTGDRYPDVTRAINEQINRGALIINYTGHGGVTGLAHEKILDITTIKAWDNEGKYPLFMTATCEFSRYDEYNVNKKAEVTSAGEEVLLNAFGGSIALFTTTRLVYSGPNHVLNEKFYEIVFEKNENGENYRLGDIIAYSKNNAGSGINKRNFTLLGDPSIALSLPENRVVTDSINNIPVEELTDTISALDFVTVSGHIQRPNGELFEEFNGTVIPIVYDKKSNLKTLSNDGTGALEFQSRNSILYKGNATAKNGRFSFSFYVPKDISYSIGDGKISYYTYSDTEDGHGASDKLIIGGIGDFSDIDTTGPGIRVFMNDSLFRNGGIVTSSPELLVFVNDPYGINTTGNGIGHDITATLNDDRINSVILNEYYQSDPDSYSSGSVRYPYDDLPEGKHIVEVKVWDIFNNSATESVDFIVVESNEMLLEQIYNYPNPFVDETFFNVEHNRPSQDLEVVIRIYDMRGNLVSVLQQQLYSSGYRLDPLSWQGNSMGGATLGGGLYVYKVLVRTTEGEEASGSGRLIIKR